MSCGQSGTAGVAPRYCGHCGKLEHGSAACCEAGGYWSVPGLKWGVTYRVLAGRLFVVDPGSPPRDLR